MVKKIYFLLILLIMLVSATYADGSLYYLYRNQDAWILQPENSQNCYIDYKNGSENMIISIQLNNVSGEKALWIFPIPATPNNIKINNMKHEPILAGHKITLDDFYSDLFSSEISLVLASQIYPLVFLIPMYLSKNVEFTSAIMEERGITVYNRVTNYGLTTEVITADKANSLRNYLRKKNVSISQDSTKIFQEYINKNYSFVITWISNLSEAFNNYYGVNLSEAFRHPGIHEINPYIFSPAVSITFPTKKIYFPLKPTSIYGNTEIPIIIRLVGFFKPEIYPEIKPHTSINYYLDGDVGYTRIKIDTASKNLKKDLWIEPKKRSLFLIKLNIIMFIEEHEELFLYILVPLLFIIYSILCSFLAGKIVFRRDETMTNKKLVLLGLLNVFTIIGVSIGITKMKTKKENAKTYFILLFTIFVFFFSPFIYLLILVILLPIYLI